MTIAELKSRLSLGMILNHYGLIPDRNNRLHCPWHDDKTPSLQVYPKTNTWTCFSSNCSAGSGDQIDFILKKENCSKHEAIMRGKSLVGEVAPLQQLSLLEPKPKSELPRQAVLLKYYQSVLHGMSRSKNGKAYAAGRHLNIEGIGFSSYQVGGSWEADFKSSAEKLGLLKLKNCLIFPIKNKAGQVVNIYGRSIGANPKMRHFYLAGGHQGLYPNYVAGDTERLILVESIIDAASVGQYVKIPVLALYGANGFTPAHRDHLQALKSLKEVILFFDGDEAGRKAEGVYESLLKELCPGIKVSRVVTPEGEDPNSLLDGHNPDIYDHLLKDRLYFSTEKKEPIEKSKPIVGELLTSNKELLLYQTPDLLITILGGIKLTGLDRLRVTLKVESAINSTCLPLRYALDMYHAKQVELLVEKVSTGFNLSTTHSSSLINELTTVLEDYRVSQQELVTKKKEVKKVLSDLERSAALSYLKGADLLGRTLEDIGRSGLVGERNNALIAYLSYTSRKRSRPLHIMCLGASGSGKTYLQEKVSSLIPEEDKLEITSLSDNAFYYFGRHELQHKLILIEDLDGAQNAEYPLREIQTKRRLSKTVTIKDNKGMLKTVHVVVEGPVCVSGCTTREQLYEDNANRCILLYIDDSRDQDARIMAYQQQVSAGLIKGKQQEDITHQLQNVQRLLRRIKVVNRYAHLIELPSAVFKPRRTLLLLLSFIETITFYHQYQRVVKTNADGIKYIESTAGDVESGFRMMKDVLFSKSDELSKATRNFLERLKGEVKVGEIFKAQQVRKKWRITKSTLNRHVYSLLGNGYLSIKGGSRNRGYEYEVLDYKEYEVLKLEVEEKLAHILSQINKK